MILVFDFDLCLLRVGLLNFGILVLMSLCFAV